MQSGQDLRQSFRCLSCGYGFRCKTVSLRHEYDGFSVEELDCFARHEHALGAAGSLNELPRPQGAVLIVCKSPDQPDPCIFIDERGDVNNPSRIFLIGVLSLNRDFLSGFENLEFRVVRLNNKPEMLQVADGENDSGIILRKILTECDIL